MTKNYVELKLKADPYLMIRQTVADGLGNGFYTHYKHDKSANPLTDNEVEALCITLGDEIMNSITDLFYCEEDE